MIDNTDAIYTGLLYFPWNLPYPDFAAGRKTGMNVHVNPHSYIIYA